MSNEKPLDLPETGAEQPANIDAVKKWNRKIAWEIYRPSLVASLIIGALLLFLDHTLFHIVGNASSTWIGLTDHPANIMKLVDKSALLVVSMLGAFLVTSFSVRLRMRERVFKRLMEKTTDFSFIINSDQICVSVTDSVTPVLGYLPNEIIGRQVMHWVHPDSLINAGDMLSKIGVADSSLAFNDEFCILAKDGTYLDMEITISNMLDVSGIRGIVVHNKDITLRKQAERQRLENEQHFKQLFSNMANPAAIIETVRDHSGVIRDIRFLEINQAMRDYFPSTDILHKNALDIIPEMNPAWIEKIAETAVTGEASRFTEYAKTFGRYFDVSTFRFGGEQVALTMLDVTEQVSNTDLVRRQRDLALELNLAEDLDQVLKIALEGSIELSGMDSGGVYLIDDFGNLRLACHKGVAERFIKDVSFFPAGHPRVNVILEGKQILSAYKDLPNSSDEENREALRVLAVTPISHKSNVIGCLNLASHELESINDRSKQILETLASQIGNAIAIKYAAQKLRASEHFLTTILNSVAEAVIAADVRGKVMFMNPTAEFLCAISAGEARGRGIHEIYPVEDERSRQSMPEMIDCILTDERPHSEAELLLCNAAGREHPIAHAASAIRDESGSLLGVVVVFRDLTDRRNIEMHMRQQQRLESIGTLASGVAHEINNPINVIMNNGELIRDVVTDMADIKQCAEEVLRESHRIAGIVRNLLSFSRREQRGDAESVTVRELVESSLVLTGKALQKNQVAVEIDIPGDLPIALWRGQQIQQVLVNLLTNANDALADQPSGETDERKIRISATAQQNESSQWIRIEVANNGPEIDPTIQSRIFDPFFTTKERDKGTGLGLSVSYGIIREHGGKFAVESRKGDWTRFTIELPLRVADSYKIG